MKDTIKQISFDDIYVELMEKGEVNFCYAKTKVELKISNRSTRNIGIYVSKQHGNYHGCSFGTSPYYYSLRRQLEATFLRVAGKPLPLTDEPLELVWSVMVDGYSYPIAIQAEPLDLKKYLVVNPQSADEKDNEYCFEIKPEFTPLLNYPREGDFIFIPVDDVWSREVRSELQYKHRSYLEIIAAKAAAKFKGQDVL